MLNFFSANVGGKVLVECVKEGGRLRIRPVSQGYHPHWNVQFPRDIRKEGCIYVVDELLETVSGGFYRVKGDVKMLSTATDKFKVIDVTKDAQLNDLVC